MGRNIKEIFWGQYWNKRRTTVRVSYCWIWKFKISLFTEEKKRKEKKSRVSKTKNGGFLNRYDFAYAHRNTFNQASKVAPGVIKAATNDINNIAKQRIDQTISKVGKEMELVPPKIVRGAIEDVYQTPVRLLWNSGKQQLNKLKKNILN